MSQDPTKVSLPWNLAQVCIRTYYYLALSQKDGELSNSRIWLAELNIEGGSAKKPDEEKSKEEEQNLADLNSAHCSSQAKCQYKPVTQIKLFLFAPCVQKPLRSVCTHDPLGKILDTDPVLG